MKPKHNCKECAELSEEYAERSKYWAEKGKDYAEWSKLWVEASKFYANKCRCGGGKRT